MKTKTLEIMAIPGKLLILIAALAVNSIQPEIIKVGL